MIFNEEQNKQIAGQITVGNAVIAIQVIDRVVQRGALQGAELSLVADCRDAMTTAVKTATDTDYDEAVAKAIAAAQAAQQQSANESDSDAKSPEGGE